MRHIITLSLLCLAITANARQITLEEASATAQEFFNSFTVEQQTAQRPVRAQTLNTNNGNAPYYIFNATGNNGFVIISGDDRANVIMGYSDKGSFDFANLPPQLAEILNDFSDYITNIGDNGTDQSRKRLMPANSDEILLKTANWGQQYPYNSKCPKYMGNTLPAGCSAIALAQLLHYIKNPLPGLDVLEYVEEGPSHTEISIDYSNARYNWDIMPDKLTQESPQEQIEEVSRLIFEAGAACKMDWDEKASSAPMPFVALQHYYNFDCNFMFRSSTPTELWIRTIRENILNDRPVIVAGRKKGETNGHAFLIDGINEEGYCHINWGWNGECNGWYDINYYIPESEQSGYSDNQQMICDIAPRTNGNTFSLKPYICGGTSQNGASVVTTNDYNYEKWTFASCVVAPDNDDILILGNSRYSYTYPYDIMFPGYKTLSAISYQPPTGLSDGEYLGKVAYSIDGESDWQVAPMPNDMAIRFVVEDGQYSIVDSERYHSIYHLIDVTPAAALYSKSTLYLNVIAEKLGCEGNYSWSGHLNLTDNTTGKTYQSETTVKGELVYDQVPETITFASKYTNPENQFAIPAGKYTVGFPEGEYYITDPDIQITVEESPDYAILDSNGPYVNPSANYYWCQDQYVFQPRVFSANSIFETADIQVRLVDNSNGEDYLWDVLSIPLNSYSNYNWEYISNDLWPLSGTYSIYLRQVSPDGLRAPLNPDYIPAEIHILPFAQSGTCTNPVLEVNKDDITLSENGELKLNVTNRGDAISDIDVVAYIWSGKTSDMSKTVVTKLSLKKDESQSISFSIGEHNSDFEISLRASYNSRGVTFVDTENKPLKINSATLSSGIDNIFTDNIENGVEIYDLRGILISTESNQLQPGIYIMKRGNVRKKIFIRQ